METISDALTMEGIRIEIEGYGGRGETGCMLLESLW